MHLFFAAAAAMSYFITIADTKNAFQQSPPPLVPCYLEINDAVISRYKKKFGESLDPQDPGDTPP
jgi:hypothetical protein